MYYLMALCGGGIAYLILDAWRQWMIKRHTERMDDFVSRQPTDFRDYYELTRKDRVR